MRERDWLQYIADIALDRDGHKSAEDLGALVDELRYMAIAGLNGDLCPIPATHTKADIDRLNDLNNKDNVERKKMNERDSKNFWKDLEKKRKKAKG